MLCQTKGKFMAVIEVFPKETSLGHQREGAILFEICSIIPGCQI